MTEKYDFSNPWKGFDLNIGEGLDVTKGLNLGQSNFGLSLGGETNPLQNGSNLSFMQMPDILGEGFTQDMSKIGSLPDVGATQPSFMDKLFGYSTTKDGTTLEKNGYLGGIADGASSIANIYLGLKSLGLAEDTFDLQKEAYQENLAASKADYNYKIDSREEAIANARSNADLGIADNATAAERDAAEKERSEERAKPRRL